jgi:hypothetical protein
MKHTSLSLLLLPVQSTFGRGTWVIVLDSLPEVALRTRVQPQHQRNANVQEAKAKALGFVWALLARRTAAAVPHTRES